MLKNMRSISIDVCDLDRNPICNIFDSAGDTEHSAFDIYVKTQRNGSKTLTFSLPSSAEQGEEDNWRLQYMLPEYKIRTIIDNVEDYFILTQDSITHDKRNKKVNITCPHIAMLLKYKNMDLEFEGNDSDSIGTANALATTVLKGTDWSYDAAGSAIFYEKDGTTEKVRTLKASVKTGAFSLMSKIADLFDAKPVYDGAAKTVKLLPMNPFEIDDETGLPDMQYASTVLELNYGVNLKNVKRTRDSESMVTRLNVAGASGDDVSGYCGIEELTFSRYIYTKQTDDVLIGLQYTSVDGSTQYAYADVSEADDGDELWFSVIDRASEMYIWNNTKQEAYRAEYDEGILKTWELTTVDPRLYSFLLDFTYYAENGMLTDTMLQTIATFQMTAYDYLETIQETTVQYNSDLSTLTSTIGVNDYCKIAVSSVGTSDAYRLLTLDLANYPDDGIIYHTQAQDDRRDEWFTWRVATGLNNYNDSINEEACVLYIIKENGTWIKTYIKEIIKNSDDVISQLVLYCAADEPASYFSGAEYYLFSANTISGTFGAYETEVESTQISMVEATTWKQELHTVYYQMEGETAVTPPDLDWSWRVVSSKVADTKSKLYFYCSLYGDSGWNLSGIGQGVPGDTQITQGYYYYYCYGNGLHYRRLADNTWATIYTEDETYSDDRKWHKELDSEFTKVWVYVNQFDMQYWGQYEKYVFTATTSYSAGNYYFEDSYKNKILFSTDYTLASGETWTYTSKNKYIEASDPAGEVVTSKFFSCNAGTRYKANELDATSWSSGYLGSTGAPETTSDTSWKITGNMSVRSETEYMFRYFNTGTSPTTYVFWYTEGKEFISRELLAPYASAIATAPTNAAYLRICTNVTDMSSLQVYRTGYANYIIYNDKEYKLISPWVATGTKNGMIPCLTRFLDYSDQVYEVDLPAVEAAQEAYNDVLQDMIDSLGDEYRQGYWVDTSYIDGQEQKLFDDAVDNLDELAKPKTTYNISFLDLYSTDDDEDIKWPDIDIESAVHIIDDELNISQWAYLDTVNKCYDCPWKTTIEINTTLTTMTQQSFQDVVARIAEVAEETKINSDTYARASSLLGNGQMLTEKLEGTINTMSTKISGASSTMTTDDRGNVLYSSQTDNSNLMISGAGILVASNTDEFGTPLWRTAITGDGIVADEITTGTLNAALIEAGAITADKLSASVGEELDISSNVGLLLFATVDGTRPAGSLNVRKDGEAFIYINANEGIVINGGATTGSSVTMTGATTNIFGGDINIKTDDETGEGGTITIEAQSELNIAGSTVNVTTAGSSEGQILIDGGSVEIASGSTFTAADANGNTFTLDEDGATILGQDVYLLTNSGTAGHIYLGSDDTYMDSSGNLSFCDGTTVIAGASGDITTTGTMSLNSGGALDVNSGAGVNVNSGGDINVASGGDINVTGGALNVNTTGEVNIASGGSIDIASTGQLTIDSDNFIIDDDGDVTILGTLYATEGRIGCDENKTGGWVITEDTLTSGEGTSAVGLSSDDSVDPDDVALWNKNTTYAVGDLVKVKINKSGNTVYRVYRATATSTNKQPNKTAGKNYWEVAEETIAFWAGDDDSNEAPFRVYRDGTVTITMLEQYDPETGDTELIELLSSTWMIDAAYQNNVIEYNKTENSSTGEITLTIKLRNGTELPVSFNGASSGWAKALATTSVGNKEGYAPTTTLYPGVSEEYWVIAQPTPTATGVHVPVAGTGITVTVPALVLTTTPIADTGSFGHITATVTCGSQTSLTKDLTVSLTHVQAASWTTDHTIDVTASVYHSGTIIAQHVRTIDASSVYDEGVDSVTITSVVGTPVSSSSTYPTFSVTATASNGKTKTESIGAAMTHTETAWDSTTHTKSVTAIVYSGSTIMAKHARTIDASSVYDEGVASVTVTDLTENNIVWASSDPSGYMNVTATASNGQTKTSNLAIDATTIYNRPTATAVTTTGSWTWDSSTYTMNGPVTATVSNGNSANFDISVNAMAAYQAGMAQFSTYKKLSPATLYEAGTTTKVARGDSESVYYPDSEDPTDYVYGYSSLYSAGTTTNELGSESNGVALTRRTDLYELDGSAHNFVDDSSSYKVKRQTYYDYTKAGTYYYGTSYKLIRLYDGSYIYAIVDYSGPTVFYTRGSSGAYAVVDASIGDTLYEKSSDTGYKVQQPSTWYVSSSSGYKHSYATLYQDGGEITKQGTLRSGTPVSSGLRYKGNGGSFTVQGSETDAYVEDSSGTQTYIKNS